MSGRLPRASRRTETAALPDRAAFLVLCRGLTEVVRHRYPAIAITAALPATAANGEFRATGRATNTTTACGDLRRC